MDIKSSSNDFASQVAKISSPASVGTSETVLRQSGQLLIAQVISTQVIHKAEPSGAQGNNTASSVPVQPPTPPSTNSSGATSSTGTHSGAPVAPLQTPSHLPSSNPTPNAPQPTPSVPSNALHAFVEKGASTTNPPAAAEANDKMAALAKLQAAYNIPAPINSLTNQNAMGKRPNDFISTIPAGKLIEANIQLRGSSPLQADQLLKVVTDRFIQAGDKLVLRKLPDGQLNLLGKTTQATELLTRASPSQLKTLITPLPSLTQMKSADQKLIHSHLASALPKAKDGNHLLNNLNQLQQTLNKLSPPERTAWLGKQLTEAIKELNHVAPKVGQLTTQELAKSFLNNGIFLENRLQKSIGLHLNEQLNVIGAAKDNDQKALLTKVLDAAQTQVAALTSPQANASIVAVTQGRNAMDTPFVQLLAQLLNSRSLQTSSQDAKLTQAKLAAQIKHLATNSLAKIQMNQLQSLLTRVESDGTQSFSQFDLPLRYHNELHQLQVQLFTEDVHIEDDGKEKDEGATTKQWCILLALELEQIGSLSIELKFVNSTLKTRIWSANEDSIKAINQAKSRLVDLFEKESIKFDNIDIIHGVAHSQQTSINYNLVDVKT